MYHYGDGISRNNIYADIVILLNLNFVTSCRIVEKVSTLYLEHYRDCSLISTSCYSFLHSVTL
jgi:hypothetical protein